MKPGRSLQLRSFGVLLFCFAGCIDGFETVSAYDQERYLCEADGAATWAARVDACGSEWDVDEGCAGVFSLTGVLERTPITFESLLRATEVEYRTFETRPHFVNRVDLHGSSPYFDFIMTLRSLGVDMPPAAEERVFGLHRRAENLPDETADDFLKLELRLTAATDSVNQDGVTDAGSVALLFQNDQVFSGRFDTPLADGGHVRGCFAAFATRRHTLLE